MFYLHRFFLIDLSGIQNQLGRSRFFSENYYYSAKATISFEALPYVARQVIHTMQAIRGRLTKCVVLDLDNTLWGGVIGDDGLEGIQLGELASGLFLRHYSNG